MTLRRRRKPAQTRVAALLLFLIHTVAALSLAADPIRFREAAAETGLSFQHFIGATGEFFMTEIMGSGAALIDYDNDGDLDVYLLQGALLDPKKTLKDSVFAAPSSPLSNKLFKNLLAEDGELRFRDVTAEAGVPGKGFGMGVAVGDFDNDGYLDLYVTNAGPNILYRNNGDGTFVDVTAKSGVDDPRLSTGAAFLDYDNDGDLDLFVLSYASFTVEGNKECYDSLGRRDYCLPAQYQPLPDRLFRNDGSGRFVDVTKESRVGSATGAGLGIVAADFNADGWLDVYVANDGTPNQLWINKGNGTFEETGLLAGVAYSGDGRVEAGMGVSSGDFDGDGQEDLFVTNLTGETHALYRNDGTGMFDDVRQRLKLSAQTLAFTGFGTGWFDVDNDGDLDLFTANGAVRIIDSLRGNPYPYHQKNQLFRNDGAAVFVEITATAGPALALSEVSRGAAFGDIDNDGDLDIVVSNNNGPVRLLLNETVTRNRRLEVLLKRANGNYGGLGSRVGVFRRGRPPVWRRVHTEGSYLSASDVRLHFGLAEHTDIQAIVVQWAGGKAEVWENPSAGKVTLREGTGKPWSPPKAN